MWDLAGALSCEVVDGGPADASGPSRASDAGAPAGASDGGAPSRASDAGAASCASDASQRSRPSAAREPAAVADPWPTTPGHGLWLVRQVADQMDLRSGPRGTRAIVTFTLPRPEDH